MIFIQIFWNFISMRRILKRDCQNVKKVTLLQVLCVTIFVFFQALETSYYSLRKQYRFIARTNSNIICGHSPLPILVTYKFKFSFSRRAHPFGEGFTSRAKGFPGSHIMSGPFLDNFACLAKSWKYVADWFKFR